MYSNNNNNNNNIIIIIKINQKNWYKNQFVGVDEGERERRRIRRFFLFYYFYYFFSLFLFQIYENRIVGFRRG